MKLDTIATGDARELANEIPDESIDCIVTDPPYPKEFLPLWADLGRIAARVLKPGGFLVTYSGQQFLPSVLQALGEHLEWYWLMGLEHVGSQCQIYWRHVQQAVKPILVYYKPPMTIQPRWVVDLVKSPARSKQFHKWGQSVSPVQYLIDRFTNEGDLILDPFCGGGTTPVACKLMGRHYIAFEIDSDMAELARRRVESTPIPIFVPTFIQQSIFAEA